MEAPCSITVNAGSISEGALSQVDALSGKDTTQVVWTAYTIWRLMGIISNIKMATFLQLPKVLIQFLLLSFEIQIFITIAILKFEFFKIRKTQLILVIK